MRIFHIALVAVMLTLTNAGTAQASGVPTQYWAGADYGADLTGATDSTVAINNCLTAAASSTNAAGGVCRIESTGRVMVRSLTVIRGSSLDCQQGAIGLGSSYTTSNFGTAGAILLSGNTSSISLSSQTAIRNCNIFPAGMPFPQTSSSSWLGTALIVPVITGGASDVSLSNVLIAGFSVCFDSYQSGNGLASRVHMDHVLLDCNTGLLAGQSLDNSTYYDVHVWPAATSAYCNSLGSSSCSGATFASVQGRSGPGLSFNGAHNDGTIVGGKSLGFGHNPNLYVNSANVDISSFWSDSPNSSSGTVYGVDIEAGATDFKADFLSFAGGGLGAAYYTALNISQNGNAQMGKVNINGSGLSCIGINQTNVLIDNLVTQNCGLQTPSGQNGSPVIAIVNNTSTLSITSGRIFQGFTTQRLVDVAIPSGMSEFQFHLGYLSDLPGGATLFGSNNLSTTNITATSDLIIPVNARVVRLDNNTTINTMSGCWGGRQIVVIAPLGATFVNAGSGAYSQVFLNGMTNASLSSGASTISFVCSDGNQWFEIGRSNY